MTITDLNAKIDALPEWDLFYTRPNPPLDRELARHLRDERLGILCGGAEPTEVAVQIVHDQLFPTTAR